MQYSAFGMIFETIIPNKPLTAYRIPQIINP